MRMILLIIIVFIISCNQNQSNKKYPDQIGKYKLNSVVEGDSAVKEINTLHHIIVATDVNFIIRYGKYSEDILYISEYSDVNSTKEAYNKMISKMNENKNIPFTFLVPMKNYNNSLMTIGMGSVHYIYLSSNYLIWYSTKQKFYNEIPAELLEIYPANL